MIMINLYLYYPANSWIDVAVVCLWRCSLTHDHDHLPRLGRRTGWFGGDLVQCQGVVSCSR